MGGGGGAAVVRGGRGGGRVGGVVQLVRRERSGRGGVCAALRGVRRHEWAGRAGVGGGRVGACGAAVRSGLLFGASPLTVKLCERARHTAAAARRRCAFPRGQVETWKRGRCKPARCQRARLPSLPPFVSALFLRAARCVFVRRANRRRRFCLIDTYYLTYLLRRASAVCSHTRTARLICICTRAQLIAPFGAAKKRRVSL